MKKWIPFIVAVLVVAFGTLAGPIKVWSVGDVFTTTDLNANFDHIHQTMVGGHGARLVNSDVSAVANIALTKLNNTGGIARSGVQVGTAATTPCTTGTCTQLMAFGQSVTVTHIGAAGSGTYTVVYASRTNAFWIPTITSSYCDVTKPCVCAAMSGVGTTVLNVQCYRLDAAANTAADAVFSVLMFDDNNP
jgi:hypothetical protein